MAEEQKKDRLGFSRRYHGDTRFRQQVEDLQREAIWALMGIDADMIARAWDGDRLNITVDDLLASRVSIDERRKKGADSKAVAELEGQLSEAKNELAGALSDMQEMQREIGTLKTQIESAKDAGEKAVESAPKTKRSK